MQKIAILYDASQAVLSTFDLDEVLQRILVIARDYFHLQNVAILLLDKDTGQLCTRSQLGGEPGFDNVRVSIGTGLIGAAAKKKRPLYVPDFTKETRYEPWGRRLVRSWRFRSCSGRDGGRAELSKRKPGSL